MLYRSQFVYLPEQKCYQNPTTEPLFIACHQLVVNLKSFCSVLKKIVLVFWAR